MFLKTHTKSLLYKDPMFSQKNDFFSVGLSTKWHSNKESSVSFKTCYKFMRHNNLY